MKANANKQKFIQITGGEKGHKMSKRSLLQVALKHLNTFFMPDFFIPDVCLSVFLLFLGAHF